MNSHTPCTPAEPAFGHAEHWDKRQELDEECLECQQLILDRINEGTWCPIKGHGDQFLEGHMTVYGLKFCRPMQCRECVEDEKKLEGSLKI